MAYMIVLDVERRIVGDIGIEQRRFRYRYVGSAIDGTNGQYRTGKYLDEIDLGSVTAETIETMHTLVQERRPSYQAGDFIDRDGRSLSFERVAMPLTADGESVGAIMVGLQYLLVVDAGRGDDGAKRRTRPAHGIDLLAPVVRNSPAASRRTFFARTPLAKLLPLK